MDAIAQQNGQEAACRPCRVLTNDLIGEIAEAHGVTRCAFPTTVDDSAGAFFSSLLSGTVECTLFSSETTGEKHIPVIRPFMEIPAPEVIRYAELHPECDCCGTLPPCPCTGNGSSLADARVELDTYDRRHPATKFALANLAGTLAGIAAAQGLPASCPVCGEPIGGRECEVCCIRRNIEQRRIS